jgi:hypothetical protein
VKNEEVLHEVMEKRNILHIMNRRKANWIGYILCGNCFVKHDIKGKIEGRKEVVERLGRRSKQLQDDLKEMVGYCKLEYEALDRTLWKTCCRRGCAPLIRRTME